MSECPPPPPPPRLHACHGVSVYDTMGLQKQFGCEPGAQTCTCFADALRWIREHEWALIDDMHPKRGLYAVRTSDGAELTQRTRTASTGRPFPLDNFERRAAALQAERGFCVTEAIRAELDEDEVANATTDTEEASE